MAAIRFGPEDRDERGFIRAPEPRSLADLLPTPHAIQADAARTQPPPTKAEWATTIAVGIGVIALLAYLYISRDARPAAPPRSPATIPATAQASGDGLVAPSPIPATLPAVEVVYGYWSPDGASAGEIDLTKIVRVVELRGAWARVEMDGGGLVWTGTQEIPAALLASYVPPTARPAPIAAPIIPAATEPPPPCADAGIPGKMVQVCGYGDLESEAKAQWLAQYGGTIGIVTTPTPQEWNRP